MPSASDQYDQALLAVAPESTKAQRQGGYTTDLLSHPSETATPPHSTTQVDIEGGLPHKEHKGALKKPTPFFRTRLGIIVIAVLAIIVIAAVIGGAVGGTVHHHSDSDATDSGLGTTTSNETLTGS